MNGQAKSDKNTYNSFIVGFLPAYQHRIAYRSSRSAHARDRKAGPREPKVEGDGNRVVVAIEINNPYFFISINI